jgi:DNA repair protein RAD50
MLYNKELEELSGEAKEIEDQKKQEQIKKNIYNNNYILFKIKSDLIKLEQFIKEHEGKLKDGSKLATIKVTLTKKVEELSNTINKNIGKVEELKNNLNRLTQELKNGTYTNIEKKYNKLKLNYIASIQTQKEIENYHEALDQSLLKYHGKRMEEINKLINYYWSMTYKGKDIKSIEIKSDFEKTAKTRNYNYRIVFFTPGGSGLDMRGRCSAGQKILASIIIRLALAETFCNNCGILCLDEPTTNLDEENSKSLAKALREIIQSRSEDQNFQLIVITHDPVFVDLLGSDYCDNFWHVTKNKENFSTVTLKPINSIFNQ